MYYREVKSMDEFLCGCEMIRRLNNMEKQLEQLGLVLESDFLNNNFYGLRDDIVEYCLKQLNCDTTENKEKVIEDLCYIGDDNFSVISRKIWNAFGRR